MTGLPAGLVLPPPVARLKEGSDFADHFAVEGAKEIRQFLADFFSYRPPWLKVLFAVREPLARALGVEHSFLADRAYEAQDVSFEPGRRMFVFQVAAASEGEYWVGLSEDRPLRAVLAVVSEKLEGAGGVRYRHHMMTFVTFKNWRGRAYFTVVKPFHWLVVKAMAEAAK
ncbi:MAG: DUF2867 domain-containing protein [Acidobacteriota bacterium]